MMPVCNSNFLSQAHKIRGQEIRFYCMPSHSLAMLLTRRVQTRRSTVEQIRRMAVHSCVLASSNVASLCLGRCIRHLPVDVTMSRQDFFDLRNVNRLVATTLAPALRCEKWGKTCRHTWHEQCARVTLYAMCNVLS
jgi:hypothetical protein